MDTRYDHSQHESKITQLWEDAKVFVASPTPKSKKAFSIILPPPNANDPLHLGHAMYAVEDILVRYHRMLGEDVLWLPGTDHAGIETQYVFEKKLQKEGKSRFQYDRKTLYSMIWDYVQDNSNTAVDQLKRLGFSLDWSRFRFTLDPKVVEYVTKTFLSLHQDGLVYRDLQLVNYCTKCGTSYSDLEVVHKDQISSLYTLAYGPLQVATTRPETKFGDVALAVNPKDKRYADYIGKSIFFEDLTGHRELPVIADELVDPAFGTGVLKVTPAHDPIDFMIGQKHHLPMITTIDLQGKLTGAAVGQYAGLTVAKAREQVVADLKTKGLLINENTKYHNSVGVCYRCSRPIEPLPLPQFFLRVKDSKHNLVENVIKILDKKETKIHGAGREKILRHWLNNLVDWNISRQIIWGIPIPAWYQTDGFEDQITVSFIDSSGKYQTNTLKNATKEHKFSKVSAGLQTISASTSVPYLVGIERPNDDHQYLPETDTFDTWFSSGQWPVVTLKTQDNSEDFNRYYPTTVMETAYDILLFWVMRMLLLCTYLTNQTPFAHVYLHGLIRDSKGQKMSKSKGNVINPLEIVDKYGADSLRLALIIRSTPGQDKSVTESDFVAARNFTNKLWNAARYVLTTTQESKTPARDQLTPFYAHLTTVTRSVTKQLNSLKPGLAADTLYTEFWHWYCDVEIEKHKNSQLSNQELTAGLITFIKLLHPFIPFVTEAIWQELQLAKLVSHPLITTDSWPT
jgi:valyl-tRNA synthetase